ncbi:hypothetical protein [Psychrobacter ciconiae]|uniref:hypothetical protein n=1 Tax=Psychrobacter ciconiae TaxID=1553449 RepID=UPI0019198338|nr:hypothetical protein [Psychrobacter ciconiae]
MSILHDLSYFILAFISIVAVIITLRRTFIGYISAYTFVIPVLIVFYIMPPYLDIIMDDKFTGPLYSFTIYYALQDNVTATIYNYYLSCLMLLFTYSSTRYNKTKTLSYNISVQQFLDYFYKWRWIGYLALVAPIIVAVLSNDPSFYMKYADRPRLESNALQILASKLVSIFLPIFVLLIVTQIRKLKNSNYNISYLLMIIITILLVAIDIYIHGKRSVVLLFTVLLLLVLLLTNVVGKKTIAYLGLLLFTLFYFYLQFYGKNIEEAEGFFSVYKGLRIDFSRDYSLKFVIFHEILNDSYVLPYKGASYLFLASFFIPRSLWPDKPYPYAVYFTNSAFGDFGGSYLYGWGLTTSFVMEAISNFGVFGLVFFPIFYIIIIHRVEKLENMFLKIIAYLILMLLLVLHPMSSVLLIIIFFTYKLLIRIKVPKFRSYKF